MRIVFLTDNFPPEVNAPASRTYEHCRVWASRGHTVTVVTGFPNFPAGKVFEGYRNQLWRWEEMDGIRVLRVWTYIAANEGFLRRTLDYLSFIPGAVLGALAAGSCDMVVGTSPQFFTACAAWAAAALKGVPFVFELRDLWPESIKAVGAMKDGLVLRMLEAIELFLYRRAALIISVTESFKDILAARGVAPDKIEVVTNGVDLTRFEPRPRDEALTADLGLSGRFVAGYVGTHGMAHGLETLLDAAALLREEPFHLLFLGDGARKRELKDAARALGLENVTFLDSVPRGEVARYWSLLDASVIHLKKDKLFENVIPSKLFESFGMGLPVLLGVEGESARIVQREQAGIVFEPGDAAALARELRRLRGDGPLRDRLKSAGLAAAKRYDRLALAERMSRALESVCSPAGSK